MLSPPCLHAGKYGGSDSLLCAAKSSTRPFHRHAHDVAHLEAWVQRVGKNREKPGTPGPRRAITDLYATKADGYEACFMQIARAVELHCPRLATLLEKVWQGHASLFRRALMLHRERENSIRRAEVDMEQLVVAADRRRRQVENDTNNQELRCLVLEAELRESKAEEEAMRAKVKYYEDEVRRLRGIVSQHLSGGALATGSPHDSVNMEKEGQREGVTLTELIHKQIQAHQKQDRELADVITRLQEEHSSQNELVGAMSNLVNNMRFDDFLMGVPHIRKVKRVTVQTQTPAAARPGAPPPLGHALCSASDEKLEVKEEQEQVAVVVFPVQFRGVLQVDPASAKQIPAIGYMLRTALDFLQTISSKASIVKSREECFSEGAMASLLLRYFQSRAAEEEWQSTLARFLLGLRHFHAYRRCRILGEFLGVFDGHANNEPPPLNRRDTLFLLEVLYRLRGTDTVKEGKNADGPVRISRAKALTAVRGCLAAYMADEAREGALVDASLPCLALPGDGKPSAAPTSNKGSNRLHVVDLDCLMEESVLAYAGVVRRWEEHIAFAFDKYCTSFHVLSEMRFADDTDEGVERDCIIMQVSKAAAGGRLRRRLRRPSRVAENVDVQVIEGGMGAHGSDSGTAFNWVVEGTGDASSSSTSFLNSSRMPVTDLLTESGFLRAVQYLNPTLGEQACSLLFKVGLRIMHAQLMLSFGRTWRKRYSREHSREYWENVSTGRTQWTKPFNPSLYTRNELDKAAFIEVCLHCRVPQESPLVRLFCSEPSTLWDVWDSAVSKLPSDRVPVRKGTGSDSTVAQLASMVNVAGLDVEGLLSGNLTTRVSASGEQQLSI